MKLLSLHQAHKYKSTRGALKSKKRFKIYTIFILMNLNSGAKLGGAEFWTSGTDLGCEGNYGYCSSTRLLRDEAECVEQYIFMSKFSML
jgi:hypothetical protein